MNIARGLIAALIWALVGGITPVLVIGLCTIVSWQMNDSDVVRRQEDILWWRMHVVPALVGIPIYLGLTAWATYAPKHNYGFAKTLAIVFFVGMPLTWMLATLELMPRRYKSIEHPDIYFSEFLLLLAAPLMISWVLVAHRYLAVAHVDANTDPDNHATAT